MFPVVAYVTPVDETAIAVAQLVIGQVHRLDAAALVGPEITKLRVELEAAVAEDAGSERQVIVGREVEVVGCREFDTAAVGHAEIGKQESRFALRTQRKRDPRRVEDRNPLEVQADVAAGAIAIGDIKVDIVRREHPVLVAHGTGRVLDLVERDLAFDVDGDLTGRAPRRTRG